MSGNVIGHFTVPNLRELLTPLTQQVEESIEKEERAGREKQRNVIFLEVIFFIILSEQLFINIQIFLVIFKCVGMVQIHSHKTNT